MRHAAAHGFGPFLSITAATHHNHHPRPFLPLISLSRIPPSPSCCRCQCNPSDSHAIVMTRMMGHPGPQAQPLRRGGPRRVAVHSGPGGGRLARRRHDADRRRALRLDQGAAARRPPQSSGVCVGFVGDRAGGRLWGAEICRRGGLGSGRVLGRSCSERRPCAVPGLGQLG
jgi:hypothetical protein